MNKGSLTVVFSTRTDNPEFQDHIRETCGIDDIEILQYVNNGEYALTEIYNIGLRDSKNTVVVFTHDDVIFESGSEWGKTILRHFNGSDFGILGKAGTTSITESGKWWEERHLLVGIVWHQGISPKTGKLDTWENAYSGDFGDRIIETIMVDGVFFAIHKERIRKGFDENIKSFHFYDLDFGLSNHLEKVRVGVIFNIKIIHKSIGETNDQWELNRIMFLGKWGSSLPYHIKPEIIYDDSRIICMEEPEVAIIILARNGMETLVRTIDSICEKTNYPNYTIYVAYEAGNHQFVQNVKDSVKKKDRITFIPNPPYTPAGIKNDIARNHVAPGTWLLLFCHDDIQLVNDAISGCVQICLDRTHDIGTVGIRLHLGDDTIQFAGILLTVVENNRIRISHKGYRSYYMYHPGIESDVIGTIDAFMMIRRDIFFSLGGFSEQYAHWLEDIDLNLKALMSGRINYFAGNAVSYHYESENIHDDKESMAKKSGDLEKLKVFIQKNAGDPYVSKHIRYKYI